MFEAGKAFDNINSITTNERLRSLPFTGPAALDHDPEYLPEG